LPSTQVLIENPAEPGEGGEGGTKCPPIDLEKFNALVMKLDTFVAHH